MDPANKLSPLEDRVHNGGERLIPGVTHKTIEVVRHKSSYQFFRKIIESDLIAGRLSKSGQIEILDLGCGVGHGTYMLAEIPGAIVTGVDCSEDAVTYAKTHYNKENINYVVDDAARFLGGANEFTYVVSRHAVEHIPNGINLLGECRFSARLIACVPFDESDSSPYAHHHHVHFINEKSFAQFDSAEVAYEDLGGAIHKQRPEDIAPNSILCILSKPHLPKLAQFFSFPVPPWRPEFLQSRWLQAMDEIENDLEARRSLTSRVQEMESRIETLNSQQKLDASHIQSLTSQLAQIHNSVSWRLLNFLGARSGDANKK